MWAPGVVQREVRARHVADDQVEGVDPLDQADPGGQPGGLPGQGGGGELRDVADSRSAGRAPCCSLAARIAWAQARSRASGSATFVGIGAIIIDTRLPPWPFSCLAAHRHGHGADERAVGQGVVVVSHAAAPRSTAP